MKLTRLLLLSALCFIAASTQNFQLRRQPLSLAHDQAISHKAYYYSSRSNGLGGAVAGFIFGPILFILSFIVIYNNERKAAIDHRRMSLVRKTVREVNPMSVNEMKAADGQLVHVVGDTLCNETIVDSESGITMNGVVKIKRDVEVREFREFGSDRNRRIEAAWVSSNQPSPGGGFQNDPGAWFITSGVTKAKNVSLGNYLLSQSLKDSLVCTQKYTPTTQLAYTIGRRYQGRVKNQPVVNGEYMYFPSQPGSLDAPGTLRVKYSYCPTGDTSVISQSAQNSFVPYRIDIQQNGKPDSQGDQNACCCCLLSDCTAQLLAPIKQIDLISQNKESADEMITREHKSIECKKHAIRALAYFLMVLSICSFFSPITILIGYVPFLGGFLSNVIGLAIFIAALIVCIPLFLLAVALCWLIFHPKVGLILLGIALVITGIVLAIVFTNKAKTSDNQQAVQTAAHLLRSHIWTQ